MDIIDQAQEKEESMREGALQFRRKEGPLAIGACHYCSEPLGPGERFCSVDCRNDWERLEAHGMI